jgi:8-oxo-dGTP pyrophosphatase MutT (NUDIX family)
MREGEPPSAAPASFASFRRRLVAALAERPPHALAGLGRPAAVLVPIFERGGRPHVLLTERSGRLRAHRGEVSFPGGAVDAGESAEAAALREAEEEVGLDPSVARVLGTLDDQPTGGSGFVITPVIAEVPAAYPWRPAADEVERVLEPAIADFLAPGVRRTETWRFGDMHVPMTFYDLPGVTVWGATARILRTLLLRVGLGQP